MSTRIEKRVQVYIDSGHIANRRSSTDFDYILDEPIELADDESVTVSLTYMSLPYNFKDNHKHIKVDSSNNTLIIKHGNWARGLFPFLLTPRYAPENDGIDRSITTITIPNGSYTNVQYCAKIKTAIESTMQYYSQVYHIATPALSEFTPNNKLVYIYIEVMIMIPKSTDHSTSLMA